MNGWSKKKQTFYQNTTFVFFIELKLDSLLVLLDIYQNSCRERLTESYNDML